MTRARTPAGAAAVRDAAAGDETHPPWPGFVTGGTARPRAVRPPLEETCKDAAKAARGGAVYAAEGERTNLVATLTELRATVARLEELAVRCHDAATEAGRLSQPAP